MCRRRVTLPRSVQISLVALFYQLSAAKTPAAFTRGRRTNKKKHYHH